MAYLRFIKGDEVEINKRLFAQGIEEGKIKSITSLGNSIWEVSYIDEVIVDKKVDFTSFPVVEAFKVDVVVTPGEDIKPVVKFYALDAEGNYGNFDLVKVDEDNLETITSEEGDKVIARIPVVISEPDTCKFSEKVNVTFGENTCEVKPADGLITLYCELISTEG